MKNLIITSICILMFSCSKNEEDNSQYVLSNGVEFQILNSEGEDLLNPNTNGHLKHNEMKLFYIIDGEMKEVFEETADVPRNIFLNQETNPFQLVIGTYDGFDNPSSEQNGITRGEHIAYLQLNETDVDTIRTLWEYKENHYFVNKKVWYNGKEYSGDENFTIRK